jgi:type III pantothenate kinase
MILAIDIGNTNIVLGVMEGKEILFEARLSTDPVKTADQYSVELKNILELFQVDLTALEGSIISSVVPPVFNAVKTSVRRITGKVPLVVGPGIKTGLNIRMDNPSSVGSDLIVDAVAALAKYQPPLIIIDMGTATTISVVDEKGSYIGGCICPGVRVSLDALTSHAAQLPGISMERPKKAIGKNTIDCMRSGVLMGNAAMVDGMIDRIEEELGMPATTIITGGTARYVLPSCRKPIIYEKDLLLMGLGLLYENNRKHQEKTNKK